MEKEIIKLLYTYSLNKKIFDQNVLQILYQIFINNYYNIEKSLHSIEVVEDPKIDALYRTESKKIVLNINKIVAEMSTNIPKLKLDNQEAIYYQNIMILLCLFHELEHSRQAVVSQDKKTLYQLLIYYGKSLGLSSQNQPSTSKYANQKKQLYEKTYQYNPCERDAYIYSAKEVLEIIAKEETISTNIQKYIEYLFIKFSLSGYIAPKEKIISPTETFLTMIGKRDIWQEMPFYSNLDLVLYSRVKARYTLEERLRYGLPISINEYKQLIEKENLTSKKILSR